MLNGDKKRNGNLRTLSHFFCRPSAKQLDAKVIIPPHKTAVRSLTGDTQRDQHIKDIAQNGRIFGNTMKARALPRQKTEARISAPALNRMTNLGMPISVKV